MGSGTEVAVLCGASWALVGEEVWLALAVARVGEGEVAEGALAVGGGQGVGAGQPLEEEGTS